MYFLYINYTSVKKVKKKKEKEKQYGCVLGNTMFVAVFLCVYTTYFSICMSVLPCLLCSLYLVTSTPIFEGQR